MRLVAKNTNNDITDAHNSYKLFVYNDICKLCKKV